MLTRYDAAVVGGGSAGLSAALLLARARRRTLVLDDGRPRNAAAPRMHGFITRDGTPPLELLAMARAELEDYECADLVQAHVEEAEGEEHGFALRTTAGETYHAERILLATGVYDALPAIEGLGDAWGRSAFVCPYCDGWEVRDKRLAVIGGGEKAVALAQEVYQWSRDLIVCTQAQDDFPPESRRWIAASGVQLKTARAVRLHVRCGQAEALQFADGTRERCDGVFLQAPLRTRQPLVEMLGCRLGDEGRIVVDERGRTSVRGVYAAGDAVTAVHQVSLAVASGVCAAMALNEDLVKEHVRRLLDAR